MKAITCSEDRGNINMLCFKSNKICLISFFFLIFNDKKENIRIFLVKFFEDRINLFKDFISKICYIDANNECGDQMAERTMLYLNTNNKNHQKKKTAMTKVTLH